MENKNSSKIKFAMPVSILIAVFFIPDFTSDSVGSEIMLLIIFAIGYNILLGYGNLISLGHGALLGTGTYATTLFLLHIQENILVAILFGIIVTVLIGGIFAALALYSRGIVFGMITLALGQIAFFLVYAFSETLGGGTGIYFPNDVSGTVLGVNVLDQSNLFIILYVLMIISLAASYRIVNSPFGQVLVAIGNNEERAEYIGYNTYRHLFLGVLISSVFAGVAGSFQAILFFGAAPSALQVQQSLEVLLATIIGGAGTVWGPLVGIALFEMLKIVLTEQTDHYPLFFGIMFVLLTYFFKGGLTNQYSNLIDYINNIF